MANNKKFESKNSFWPKPFLGVFIIVGLIALWILSSQLGWHDKLKFPYFLEVFNAFKELGINLLYHTALTTSRVFGGLIIGSLGGFIVGLLMTWNKYIDAALDLLIEVLRPIPPIALIPFFILWFGISQMGKFLLISWGVFMIIVVNTIEAVKNVSPIYRRAASSLGASKFAIYRTVVIPAIIPSLIGTVRVATAFAFGVTVAAEFMGASWGLGYMIITARRTLNTETVLLGVLMIGFISWAIDCVIRSISNYLTRWSESRG